MEKKCHFHNESKLSIIYTNGLTCEKNWGILNKDSHESFVLNGQH
jgi:hypothetical protein